MSMQGISIYSLRTPGGLRRESNVHGVRDLSHVKRRNNFTVSEAHITVLAVQFSHFLGLFCSKIIFGAILLKKCFFGLLCSKKFCFSYFAQKRFSWAILLRRVRRKNL